MGPSESKLRGIATADAAAMVDRADRWAQAARALRALMGDLEQRRRSIAETWTDGDDAGAALTSFHTYRRSLEDYLTRVEQARLATEEAAGAISDAQEVLDRIDRDEVPDVAAMPLGSPPQASQGASPTAIDHYAQQVRDHERSTAARDAALERREALAAEGVRRLDGRLQVAGALLNTSAPSAPLQTEYPVSPAGAGGAGASTVVGGSTSTAGLLTGGTRTPAVASPAVDPSVIGADLSTGDEATGGAVGTGGASASSVGPAPGEASSNGALSSGALSSGGLVGGGLTGGATSAGLAAVGRNALGKLTGSTAATVGRPTSPGTSMSGRAPGPQSGPTLGRSGTTSSAPAGRSGRGPAGRGDIGSGARQGRSGARSGPRDEAATTRLAFDDAWGDDEDTAPGVIA